MKTVFFVDIDNTLINRGKRKQEVRKQLRILLNKHGLDLNTHISLYESLYEEKREEGNGDLNVFINVFSQKTKISKQEMLEMYLSVKYERAIIKGSKKLIETIRKNPSNRLIFWTDGHQQVQKAKLKNAQLYQEDDARIELCTFNGKKVEHFPDKLEELKLSKEDRVVIIDDNLEILQAAHEAAVERDVLITTVWITQETNTTPESEFSPSIIAENPSVARQMLEGINIFTIEGQKINRERQN